MNKLASYFSRYTIGAPLVHKNLTVYPLHVQNGHQREYQTLEEAMQAETLEIQEVSEGGSVPDLSATNRGTVPVLLIVGEELIGAKQNRVLNTSLLIPAQSELRIPVSCVEQGRWKYDSRRFSSSPSSSSSSLRRKQSVAVTHKLKTGGTHQADQGEVWREVQRKISEHGTSSPTRKLRDVYVQTEKEWKPYIESLEVPDAQGIIVEISGEIVGLDMFDHTDTLHLLWQKLIGSYALDAIERESKPSVESKAENVQNFLKQAQEAEDETFNSVGLGKDIRLSSKRIVGSGLVWDEKLIHASVFSIPESAE